MILLKTRDFNVIMKGYNNITEKKRFDGYDMMKMIQTITEHTHYVQEQ